MDNYNSPFRSRLRIQLDYAKNDYEAKKEFERLLEYLALDDGFSVELGLLYSGSDNPLQSWSEHGYFDNKPNFKRTAAVNENNPGGDPPFELPPLPEDCSDRRITGLYKTERSQDVRQRDKQKRYRDRQRWGQGSGHGSRKRGEK